MAVPITLFMPKTGFVTINRKKLRLADIYRNVAVE